MNQMDCWLVVVESMESTMTTRHCTSRLHVLLLSIFFIDELLLLHHDPSSFLSIVLIHISLCSTTSIDECFRARLLERVVQNEEFNLKVSRGEEVLLHIYFFRVIHPMMFPMFLITLLISLHSWIFSFLSFHFKGDIKLRLEKE